MTDKNSPDQGKAHKASDSSSSVPAMPITQAYEFKRGGVYLVEVKKWSWTQEEAAKASRYYRVSHNIDVQFIFTAGEEFSLRPIPAVERTEHNATDLKARPSLHEIAQKIKKGPLE